MAATLQDSCAFVDFNHRFLVQRLATVVHATVGEDRTLRRTHIFQSRVVSRMPEHIKTRTHVCGLRLDDPCHRVVCCLVAHPKSFHLITCFTEHFSVFLTPSHHSVPDHHRLLPLHDRCLVSGVLPVLTSLEGRQSGYLAGTLPDTRSCHSMDSILSVQSKNFSGDGKEFKKVSQAVRKAERYLH